MSLMESIRAKMNDALMIEHLQISDFSHAHQGHEGVSEKGESHLSMLVVAPIFEGMSRLHRHKMIHAILKRELSGGLHALVLTTLTPAEYHQLRSQGKI